MGIEELVIIAQLTPERNLDIPCRAVAREYRGSHLFRSGPKDQRICLPSAKTRLHSRNPNRLFARPARSGRGFFRPLFGMGCLILR